MIYYLNYIEINRVFLLWLHNCLSSANQSFMTIQDKIQNILIDFPPENGILLDRLKELIAEPSLSETDDYTSRTILKCLEETIDDSEGNSNELIPTGWSNYDSQLGGLSLGEYIIVGGRPGMGKSLVLLDLATRISLQTQVLYFSFDLTSTALMYRIANGFLERPIPLHNPADFKRVNADDLKLLKSYFSALHLSFYDRQIESMTELFHYCEKMVREKGVKVIIIDYLQMLSSKRYRNSRVLEVGYISRTLKKIALELKVCIIASSQLNRSVEMRGGDRRPVLTDIRESGGVEQDADKVFFVYRPEYYGLLIDEYNESTLSMMELILAKNRFGSTTTLKFNVDFAKSKLAPFEEGKSRFQIRKDRKLNLDEEDNPF